MLYYTPDDISYPSTRALTAGTVATEVSSDSDRYKHGLCPLCITIRRGHWGIAIFQQ